MLSIDFHEAAQDLFAPDRPYEPFLFAVRAIADHYDSATEYIVGHAEGGDKLTQSAVALQQKFSSFYAIAQTISPSKLFKAIDTFKDTIKHNFNYTKNPHPWITRLIEEVDSFAEKYDQFLTKQTPNHAALLLVNSHHLNEQLKAFFDSLAFFNDVMGYTEPSSPEGTSISLVLDIDPKLSSFLEKLNALQRIYSELCLLAAISEAEQPLRIVKIESGSIWAKVFGDTRITEALTRLIESTISYLHRQFTTEGKIASIPRKIEALDAAIQVSEKLKGIGVDTSEINDNLRKSGVVISKNLATLLDDQPKIRINGQPYSVGKGLEPALLAQRETLRITNKEERIEPTLDESSAD